MHHKTVNPAARAASVIYHTHAFFDKIENETLEPIVGGGVIPTTMHTYKLLSATRIPGEKMDKLVPCLKSRHIVVFIKGRAYSFNAFDKNGKCYRPEVLQVLLSDLILVHDHDYADSTATGLPLLTSLERTQWSKIRTKITSNKNHAKILQTIESARFAVTFDQTSPQSEAAEHKTGCFGGDVGNTWFDKSISFLVCKNGRLASSWEHSTGEATNSGIWSLHFLAREEYDSRGNAVLKGSASTKLQRPDPRSKSERSPWEQLDVQSIIEFHNLERVLKTQKVSLETQKNNLSNCIFTTPFGKGWIKKQKISPDAVMQTCLQRTFYKLRGFIPKVYESAGIIMYRNSRTETIRSVNKGSIAYCKNPSIENLKLACQGVVDFKNDVNLGQGADRHLFALYVVGRYLNQKYDLFENFPEIWQMDHVSSSSTGVPLDIPLENYPKAGSFGAQLEDGFGCAYFSPFNEHSAMAVTCYKDTNKYSAEDFVQCYWDSMVELRRLYEPGFEMGYGPFDLIVSSC